MCLGDPASPLRDKIKKNLTVCLQPNKELFCTQILELFSAVEMGRDAHAQRGAASPRRRLHATSKVDAAGASIQLEKSDVQLVVPAGAVPQVSAACSRFCR